MGPSFDYFFDFSRRIRRLAADPGGIEVWPVLGTAVGRDRDAVPGRRVGRHPSVASAVWAQCDSWCAAERRIKACSLEEVRVM